MFILWDIILYFFFFFFSSRRRHTRSLCDWSSDVCSSDLHDRLGHRGGIRHSLSSGPCAQVAPSFGLLGAASASRAGPRSEERRVGKECRARWCECEGIKDSLLFGTVSEVDSACWSRGGLA